MSAPRRAYDHRLRELALEDGDARLLKGLGVPRSTSVSWLRRGPRAVVTLDVVSKESIELQAEVLRLRQRVEVLRAIVRLLFMLVRLVGARLDETRIPDGAAKGKLLAAITRARAGIPLAVALRVLGLSPSRYHAWNRPERLCQLDDRSTCPRETPTQLTPDEIRTMRELALNHDYRHMTIRGLALHAQRIGKVLASPATWGRLIRVRGWRRPRARIHPATPKEGIRATRPNEYWHIDVTIIRLLDGTRLYLHAVIDNFSRRILAWKLAARLEPQTTCAVLSTAGAGLDLTTNPATVVADSGVENVNGEVDALLGLGHLRRVLAQVEGHVLEFHDRGLVALAQAQLAIPQHARHARCRRAPRRVLRRAAQRGDAARRVSRTDTERDLLRHRRRDPRQARRRPSRCHRRARRRQSRSPLR